MEIPITEISWKLGKKRYIILSWLVFHHLCSQSLFYCCRSEQLWVSGPMTLVNHYQHFLVLLFKIFSLFTTLFLVCHEYIILVPYNPLPSVKKYPVSWVYPLVWPWPDHFFHTLTFSLATLTFTNFLFGFTHFLFSHTILLAIPLCKCHTPCVNSKKHNSA